MKASLELLLKQSLLMTSEMRLAIDILAMNSWEIDQLIDEELKNNPCIDEDEQHGKEMSFTSNSLSSSDSETSAFLIALSKNAHTEDFRKKLLRQVGEGDFNSIEADIAFFLINNLDDDGLLDEAESVYGMIMEELDVFYEWIESVRIRVMALLPIGCGAKTVNETLMFQARHKCQFSHSEFFALLDHLKKNPEQKINHDFRSKIKNDTRLNELKMLNPRPSMSRKNNDSDQIIFPDVVVRNDNNCQDVSLLRQPSQRLVVNKRYQILQTMKQSLLKESHKRASFLLRSLKFRENSLLTVARLVVSAQADWFFHDGALKPLYLRDIAQEAGLHESSVSRIVRGKYISCHRGTLELKYFFGSAVKQENGSGGPDPSASFIKETIRSVIAKENKANPFSDQQIKELLAEQGIAISRRTVAKYRGNLKISTAHERRVWV